MQYDKDKEAFATILSKYTKIGKGTILEFLQTKNVNDIFQNPHALTNDMSKIQRIEELRFLRNTYDNLKDYSKGYQIDSPKKAQDYFRNYNMDIQDKEYFSVAFLDTKNQIIDVSTTSGTINYVVVDVRGIIKDALKHNATGILISHNHPSGNPTPSQDDIRLTKRFHDSCELLGIKFLDHVITGNLSYVSMKERYGDFKSGVFNSVREDNSSFIAEPNIGDITLHIKYQEPVSVYGLEVETDTITFSNMSDLNAFINGDASYNHLDDAVRKSDNDILLYAENANGDVVWGNKDESSITHGEQNIIRNSDLIIDEKPQERSALMDNTFYKVHANPSRYSTDDNAFYIQSYERIEGTAEARIGDVVYYGDSDSCSKLVNQLNNKEITLSDIDNNLQYGITFTQHYDEAQLIEDFGESHEHSLSDTEDILFDTVNERNEFIAELANDSKGIENVSTWETWSNAPRSSDKFNVSSISLADLQREVSALDDKPLSTVESNFSISRTQHNTFIVRSDSERFGKNAIDDKKTDNLIQDDSEKSAKDLVKEQLENGIRDVMESDKFRDWCATSGKLYFNNYSFNNAMLTYLQKPESTYVMGYGAWKDFGRQVKKGSSGIKIITPSFAKEYKKGGLYGMIRKNLQEQLKKDSNLPYAVYRLGQSKLSFTMQHNGMMGLMLDGKDVQRFNSEEECRKFIDRQVLGKVPMYYGVGTVFDVSDTYEPEHVWLKNGFKKEDMVRDDNGKPIMNPKTKEYKIINTDERKAKFVADLDLTIPEQDSEKMNTLFSVLQKVSEDKGVPMTVESINEDGVKGFYQRSKNGGNGKIVIKDGLMPTEMVATAFHEMAHADMHRDLDQLSSEIGEKIDRGMREVQAEAVSFMTASNFGISTNTSSFSYLAAWSKGKELTDLRKSLDVIFKESKALMKSIEKELDMRGLDLHLELKNQEPISKETINETVKDFTTYILEKSSEYDDISKDIVRDLKEVDNEDEMNVIKNQGNVVKEIKSQLVDLSKLNDQLLNVYDRKTQTDTINKLNALKTRIWQSENQFKVLTDRRISIVDENKNTLKKQFDVEPMKVLESLKDEFESMNALSKGDLSYLASSKFVSREYGKHLRDNPKEFVDNAVKQVESIRKAQSKNGSFVEVVFCEHWGENKIFEGGTIAHPKLANRVIEQAEKETRNLKLEAEKSGEYYPYSKCSLVLYTPNTDGGYYALHTRVDIGDGYQNNLTDHLEKACSNSKDKSVVLDAYKDCLSERPKITEKLITPVVKSSDLDKSDKTDTLSVNDWKSEINNIRGDSPSNDSDSSRDNRESERD
jgi:DNA repair protein RadC